MNIYGTPVGSKHGKVIEDSFPCESILGFCWLKSPRDSWCHWESHVGKSNGFAPQLVWKCVAYTPPWPKRYVLLIWGFGYVWVKVEWASKDWQQINDWAVLPPPPQCPTKCCAPADRSTGSSPSESNRFDSHNHSSFGFHIWLESLGSLLGCTYLGFEQHQIGTKSKVPATINRCTTNTELLLAAAASGSPPCWWAPTRWAFDWGHNQRLIALMWKWIHPHQLRLLHRSHLANMSQLKTTSSCP